ncbi:hypothetical protein D5086_026591 [Populus alba]|uniref:Uncharacterized protein n=1 Tax=Populus alba TaxID=43335 RepID=A0ACC4B2S2_POPAL
MDSEGRKMEEVERDFHGMKRKQLQALCKKHGIPANKSNAEMADLLTLTLKGIENPKEQGQGEVQNVSDSMKVTKILKNVKFKPDVEIREYEPSVYKGRKRRRRSMVNYGKVIGSPPGSRNREQRTVGRNVDEVVGKKRGRGREKKGSVGVENVDVNDNSRPPVITKEGDVQLVKGEDKSGRRRLRSREVVIEENVEGGEGDLVVSRKNSKRGESRKRGNRDGIRFSDEVSEENVSAKDDAKPAKAPSGSRINARTNESTSLLSVDFGKTESFGRTTRSRAKLRENTSSTIADKAETVEVQDEYEKALQTEEILKGAGRNAFGRKSFVPRKRLVVEILSEEGVESVKGGRRSRRNTSKKEGTSLSSGCFSKTEIVGRTSRSRSKLEENTSSVTANKAETIEIQDESQKVLHLEEPLKDFGRYALRRKSIVPQKGVAVETVSKKDLESVKDARRSKRNMAKATDSKPIVQVVTRRRTRFGAQATVESADEITEVNKEHNKAVQLEECLNTQDRNASRQKSLTAQKGQVGSEGPDEKIETIKQSRNADLKLANKVEASGQFSSEIEKAPISIGHVRGSRSNTVVLSPAFATGELGIGEAVGMVGCLKRKRGPTLETDSSTVGECLAGKPSRELAQHASRGNLVGSTVPGKIVEKKQHGISAVPVMVEEGLFTEETQIEDTGLTMPEATGDKPNFSLSCSKEVFETSDKKGCESKTSEMRTNFSEVAAGCSNIQEGVDNKTNLQETPSPTSISVMLCFANQETPENASQPIVLNEEANTVAGDMEKLAVDAIIEVGVDDPSSRSKEEDGADLGNDNLDEHGQTELQTNASDTFPLTNRFSFAKQSDFSGLENGLERKELREDIHLESGDVNDCSTELVDITSAVEGGFCDLENTGQKIRANKNEHEEASCEDRPSPAAGEKMVSFITEINLQEDGDVLLIQAAEENQNFISEENASNVFQVSRRTCAHELLHGEVTCLSAPEKGTDEGENRSSAIVPLQFTGIGKQRLPFYAGDSSEDKKIQHHDEKSTEKINSSCKDEKHVLEENEAVADAFPQSSLQDKKEVTFAIKTDICAVETTGESEVTNHSDSGKASTGVNSSPMLFEKLGGYKEMNAMRNCSIDASIDVPVSKSHEAVMVMESGRNMDGESDAEQSEFKEEKSGCAVETVHGDDNVCQKVSAEANASSLTWLISKEMEGCEGKTFDMMMGRPSDFLKSNKELASGKNTARYQCDQVVRKESVTGALLFELCDHSSSDEVAGNADATLTPTIEIFGGKKVGSWGNTSKSIEGINMWTGQETISVGSDSKADTFTQVMNDRFDEEKTAEVSDGDLYDHISKYDYGGEFLKINDAGSSASPEIASADCEGIDETSNGFMGSELELGVKAGKFDDLEEVNALELERSASVSLENRISMDVIAAFNVEKVEDDSKLYQRNIDDEKEYSIVSLPQVTPKSIGEHSVEEGLLHASKDDCVAASNDASNNIKADRAGSVAVIGKICFEKTEGCTLWTERTPISPQIPKSSGKKAQQSSFEHKLFAESSGICGMGSSADAVSELNVLLSHGEKYKSHPGSKSIGNEAGVKVMASNDRGSGAIDKVSSGAAAKMDILEEVVIGVIQQTVISAEASQEMAESPPQERFLSCSKSEESPSPDTPCRLPEITSGASLVQRNGPESYRSIPTEQGEFHQGDFKVLIAQKVGAEEVREALATDDTNLESNPSDPREVAIEQANEHPDALNESLLMVGLDYQTQNQQSCGCSLRGDCKHALKERERHSIETEATNCLHQLDEGVFSEEIVDFGNGFATSPFKRQRDVDSSAGTSVSVFQHCITENDAWELNLFSEENEQDENQTSGARFLHTNLRNEGAGKVYENIAVTEQAAIQVDEEQHGELWQVMDEQIEEEKHTYFSVSDEPSFEDVEGSKKQDCVLLEIDSIQERINCENHQNKSVNTEHSYDSKEKEIFIDVNEVNGYHDVVSSEQMGERNSSYLKQYNNESLSVEDIGVIENLSENVSAKPNISALDQSTEIINSTSSQDIAARDDQTHQLKLPSSQKGVSCDKEEETHSSDAKQLTTSLVRREARKTGFVQATPQKMVTYTGMKENLASIKREKRGNMTAPNPLSKRRALGNLRNN